MSVKKFRFISPGVEFREIDNSQLPSVATDNIGPVVVGRSQKGPAMQPIQVNSFSEFIEVFGAPTPGTVNGDVWREALPASPTYGAYAAEAWLRNNAPLTFVRLLGDQSDNAEASGKAGWETDNTPTTTVGTNGGAYGLFVIDSGSTESALTGALAAVWYLQTGSIVLSGSTRDGGTDSGSATLFTSNGSNKQFRAIIKDANDATVIETDFNFNRSSDKYIRRVFNTNPILTNTDIFDASDTYNYWLGESYERHLDTLVTSSAAGSQFAMVMALEGSHSGDVSGGTYKYKNQAAKTGWFISQDFDAAVSTFEPRNLQKLFRLHSLTGGTWDSKNLKISIQNVRASTSTSEEYGTFDVVVRRTQDSDANPQIIERYSGCNLNPASADFIAVRIGDKYLSWDDIKKRFKEIGTYDNRSSYIRVEMNDSVMNGMVNPASLPFGVFGPEKHKAFALISGSANEMYPDETDEQTQFTGSLVKGAGSVPHANQEATEFVNVGSFIFTGSFEFPELQLRSKATDGSTGDAIKSYYGVTTTRTATSTLHDDGYADYVRPLSGDYRSETDGGEFVEYSWVFTLDDVSGSSTQLNNVSAPAEYMSGSRAGGTSISAVFGYESLLDNNHNRFTTPLYGGFDGVDITEMNPFRNSAIASTPTETSDSVYYTYKKAIEAVSDPEVIDHNLAVIPGLTNEGLTGLLTRICENRGDSLALIDPKGGFTAREESSDTFTDRLGDTATVVSNMKARGLSTSYGAAYEPWVQIRDSLNGSLVWVPPSVVALGTMARTDKVAAPWFAPAGFTRGGLTKGDSGLDVVNVSRRLYSDDRDDLYRTRINSIAKMPNEGIVVWGQKTLQTESSALDRVNVRRLMIDMKKRISRVAATTLFEPNVAETWKSFKASASPILDDAKSRFGINKYKLILDETTTTDDLVDRNIMYAKIIIVPTRTVEFFAIDFVITNTGAEFDD